MKRIINFLIIFTILLSFPVYGSVDSGSEKVSVNFEDKYDFSDRNLDINDVDFNRVVFLNSVDEIETYFKSCLEKEYKYIVFATSPRLSKEISLDKRDDKSDCAWGYYNVSRMGLTKYYKANSVVMVFNITYYYSREIIHALETNTTSNLNVEQLSALRAAQEFTETIKDLPEYDKELAIHNFVCKKIDYIKDESLSNIRDCYGGLVLGRGVCSAYADSFNLLCYLSGIKSGCIDAVSYSGSNHELNYVILNGKYYFVDCTFDDGFKESRVNDGVGTFYFNAPLPLVTDKYIIPYMPFNPVITIDDMYYYKRNNAFFNSLEDLNIYSNNLTEASYNNGEFAKELLVYVKDRSDDDIKQAFLNVIHKLKQKSYNRTGVGDYIILKVPGMAEAQQAK